MALPSIEDLLKLQPIKLYEVLRDNAPPRDEREALTQQVILVLAKRQEMITVQAAAQSEAITLLIQGTNKLRELLVEATGESGGGAGAGGAGGGPVDAETANAHIGDISAEQLQQQVKQAQQAQQPARPRDATPFPAGAAVAPPPGARTDAQHVTVKPNTPSGPAAPVTVAGEVVVPNQSVSAPSRIAPISPNVSAK